MKKLECIAGTNVPIVEVIKQAKEFYVIKSRTGRSVSEHSPYKNSMSTSLSVALTWLGCESATEYNPPGYYIKLFSLDKAIESFGADRVARLFGAKAEFDDCWWNINDSCSRIKYFDWLIEQYSKEYK